MVKFLGKILQFGFGSVGKSFFEIVAREIEFDINRYYVITRCQEEYEIFIRLGGIKANFINLEISKTNFGAVFSEYLSEGDLLIDFAESVGTNDLAAWCAQNNILYINTGNGEWPESWLNIFTHDRTMCDLIAETAHKPDINKYPIVLQHGNNPGLVSHFVKAAITYIVQTQYKKNKPIKKLLKQNKFNEVAYLLGIKMIHINDIDSQKMNLEFKEDRLYNTWCTDTFFFEMLTEAAFNIGNHEKIELNGTYKFVDLKRGFLEFNKLAIATKCRTYYPRGYYEGFVVPHDETITIARHLEVRHKDKIIRPTVIFVYLPCDLAMEYLIKSKVNDYPPKPDLPQDTAEGQEFDEKTIIHGHKYPSVSEVFYDQVVSGTEYVGVLLLGENFNPVWVGNRITPQFLQKKFFNKKMFWQTPTITPVAASALAAVCWMLKNKEKGGIYLPDDILDYKFILNIAEKYISPTICHTFEKDTVDIDFSDIQIKNFLVK